MIRKKKTSSKLVIDITGPQGNAFCLLGIARDLCRKLGKDWKALEKKMTADDYENLLKEMDKELGDYIIIER